MHTEEEVEVKEETKDGSSQEEVIQMFLDNPPANVQEFISKLGENGFELVRTDQKKDSVKGEMPHASLPSSPELVILRMDAAKNALAGEPAHG